MSAIMYQFRRVISCVLLVLVCLLGSMGVQAQQVRKNVGVYINAGFVF